MEISSTDYGAYPYNPTTLTKHANPKTLKTCRDQDDVGDWRISTPAAAQIRAPPAEASGGRGSAGLAGAQQVTGYLELTVHNARSAHVSHAR